MSGARAPASSVPGESAPSEPSATRERVRVAGRLLAHPLIITLFSALLAAVVLPPLTRAWQDRQKELELKRDLVTQIAETSTRAVRRGVIGQQDEARREWLVDRSVSNAIVATYFPDLANCWFIYSDVITSFLHLPSTQHRKEIDTRLEQTRTTCEWDQGLPSEEGARLDELAAETLPTAGRRTLDKSKLGTLLLIGRDGIIRRIVEADARGYASGLF